MIDIKFVKDENRAVAYDNELEVGECNFIETENTWNITHTGVNSEYQGKGIAKKLVECVIENSRNYEKKLVADCSYAKNVIESK